MSSTSKFQKELLINECTLVKSPAKKLQEAADEFTKKQTNPNPNVSGKNPTTGEEFAKGGIVGYNRGGGVQTLFRRKAS